MAKGRDRPRKEPKRKAKEKAERGQKRVAADLDFRFDEARGWKRVR